MTAESLMKELKTGLEKGGSGKENLLAILDAVLRHFDCAVGTVHALDPESGLLRLRAQRGVPEVLMDKIGSIPIGKGMAGLAAERREPVQLCNLQTDTSGQAKPAARKTGMEGSIALPILVGDQLRGTLGVAKPTEYDFTAEEKDLLMRIGSLIGPYLK